MPTPGCIADECRPKTCTHLRGRAPARFANGRRRPEQTLQQHHRPATRRSRQMTGWARKRPAALHARQQLRTAYGNSGRAGCWGTGRQAERHARSVATYTGSLQQAGCTVSVPPAWRLSAATRASTRRCRQTPLCIRCCRAWTGRSWQCGRHPHRTLRSDRRQPRRKWMPPGPAARVRGDGPDACAAVSGSERRRAAEPSGTGDSRGLPIAIY